MARRPAVAAAFLKPMMSSLGATAPLMRMISIRVFSIRNVSTARISLAATG